MMSVKNRIRSLLALQREEVRLEVGRYEKLFSKEGLSFLEEVELEEPNQELLSALLKTYQCMRERIRESVGMIKRVYLRMKEAKLIDTVPGFGEILSVLVAVEIVEVGWFASVDKLHSYAGLIPSTHSSGERTYPGNIIGEGIAG